MSVHGEPAERPQEARNGDPKGSGAEGRLCGSCRWWDEQSSPWFAEYQHERGKGPGPHTAPGRWGRCAKVAMLWPEPAVQFFVFDASGYRATLGTRSDFGCTEHEPGAYEG